MARRKKEILEDVIMEEMQLNQVEELPVFPEIPLPEEEPISENQKDLIIEDLERKNNDLIQQLYSKERELDELRTIIDEQAQSFEKTIARLVYDVYGR